MDSRKCQTATATPAEPGDLLTLLGAILSIVFAGCASKSGTDYGSFSFESWPWRPLR